LKITVAGFAIQCELSHRATDQDAGIRACITTRTKRALPVFQCLTLQQLFWSPASRASRSVMACATLFPVAGTKLRERDALSQWTRPPRYWPGFNPLWPDLNLALGGLICRLPNLTGESAF